MLTTSKMKKQRQRGFTLFIAIIVMGTLLLVAAGVTNLALKQAFISTSGRLSQNAFYAADAGMECALYWDVNNPAGVSAFATTSSPSSIICNSDSSTVGGLGGEGFYSPVTHTFSFDFSTQGDPYCAVVTVNKAYVSGVLKTTVESKGYNTCDPTNPRRVERAVRATY